MPRLKSCVLTRTALSIVPVAEDHPFDAFALVVTSNSRNGVPLTSSGVLHLVGFSVCSVDGTDKHVVGDVVEMATVFQPWAGH